MFALLQILFLGFLIAPDFLDSFPLSSINSTSTCMFCPDEDIPVCAEDGITYKNECQAECMGKVHIYFTLLQQNNNSLNLFKFYLLCVCLNIIVGIQYSVYCLQELLCNQSCPCDPRNLCECCLWRDKPFRPQKCKGIIVPIQLCCFINCPTQTC